MDLRLRTKLFLRSARIRCDECLPDIAAWRNNHFDIFNGKLLLNQELRRRRRQRRNVLDGARSKIRKRKCNRYRQQRNNHQRKQQRTKSR